MHDLEPHPLAEIFPLMTGADFDALVADICQHGMREPIALLDGMILDGRNRYRACRQIGIEPSTKEWPNGEDPRDFVISMNMHRRHLDTSQRAMVAAKLASLPPWRPARSAEIAALSQPEAAKLMSVSRDSVCSARTVLTRGTPEEIKAVEEGHSSVNITADRIRERTPQEERRKGPKPTAVAGPSRKAPPKLDRHLVNAEIWKNLKTALDALTSLPLPREVARVVRSPGQINIVNTQLETAINWLKEFEDAWTS